MLKKSFVFCLLIITVLTNACGGLTHSDNPVTKTWWLSPFTGMVQMAYPQAVLPVEVAVTVIPGLDTDKILTLSNDAELNQFSGARWVDNLPEMMTSLVARTMQSTGRFQITSERTGNASETCKLRLEVQEFFAVLSDAGQVDSVRFGAEGQYQCESAAPIPIQLRAERPVDDPRMNRIIRSFQQALDEALQDLLNQI